MDSKLSSKSPASLSGTLNSVTLHITNVGHIPSFKNSKRAIQDDNTGQMRTLTQGKVKKRMNRLEDAIVYALYSWYPIDASETRSECSKQLRTLLSGLCDDSIREIPCGEWSVEYVPPGQEGLRITIERL